MRAFAALLLAGLSACAAPAGGDDPVPIAIDGQPAFPTAPAEGRVHVLVFTSLECPIANAYVPTLRQLAEQWQHAPVDLFLVVADPTASLAALQRHAADYQLPGRIVLDPGQRLVRTCSATMTPEAVVWTSTGVTYRGRIDDAWGARGNRRPAVVHDLREAVQRTLAGDRTFAAGPPPIGCHLPTP